MLLHDRPFMPPGLGRARRAITATSNVTSADQGIIIDATSGTYDVTADAAATLGSGFSFGLYNSGSGVVTFNPASTETIRLPGNTTPTTLALNQGEGAVFGCDGSNWKVLTCTTGITATAWIGNDTATSPNITLNGAAGNNRSINGRTAGLNRWVMNLGNSTAESGSNAGSDFQLRARDDAGSAIDNPISITRASGGTITFSRTLTVASGIIFSNETLSTYDEGTFTPTLGGASVIGTPTYAAQVGRYTRIGNKVFCDIYVSITAKTAISGTLIVGGLPFTIKNTSNYNPSVSVGFYEGLTFTAGDTQLTPVGQNNNTYLVLYCSGSGTASNAISDSGLAASATLNLSIAYEI